MNTVIGFIQQFIEYLFEITRSFGLPSYAMAIIFLTVIVKVLLYPLMRKQMQSMANLSKIQPEIAAVERKYGNNPAKKNEALVKLYQKHNINPMGGCLPLLIQLPIFVALYRALLNFVPAYPEFTSFFWIENISLPDPSMLYLPILVGLSTFVQQKVMITNKNDNMQRVMLYVMPIMLGGMAMQFPAGLCLYWITYSVIGALQQIIVNYGSMGKAVNHMVGKEEEQAEEISAQPKKKAKNNKEK